MDSCIFCKIVKGAISSYKVWEDDEALAFLTIRPHKDGHLLLIPKNHVEDLFELADRQLQSLILKSKLLAQVLKKVYQPKSGKVSLVVMGMEIPHTHIHLFPLDKESDIDIEMAHNATPRELEENMNKIKAALE